MYMYSHLKKTYIFASYFFVFGYFCFYHVVRKCTFSVCVWVSQLVYACVCVGVFVLVCLTVSLNSCCV